MLLRKIAAGSSGEEVVSGTGETPLMLKAELRKRDSTAALPPL
jgi:hypothetical protein